MLGLAPSIHTSSPPPLLPLLCFQSLLPLLRLPAMHGLGGLGSVHNDAAANAVARGKLGSGVVRLLQAPAVVALAAALAVSTPAPPASPGSSEPLCNLPPELSGEQGQKSRIRHPKSAQAARCTSKCVSTCVLGGYGAPGVEGPFNVRRPLVVFKDTFRSRQYCLAECSDVCNLIKDGEDDQ